MDLQVTINLNKVPFYEGAIDCLEMGIESSLQVANIRLRRAVNSDDQVENLGTFLLDGFGPMALHSMNMG